MKYVMKKVYTQYYGLRENDVLGLLQFYLTGIALSDMTGT